MHKHFPEYNSKHVKRYLQKLLYQQLVVLHPQLWRSTLEPNLHKIPTCKHVQIAFLEAKHGETNKFHGSRVLHLPRNVGGRAPTRSDDNLWNDGDGKKLLLSAVVRGKKVGGREDQRKGD